MTEVGPRPETAPATTEPEPEPEVESEAAPEVGPRRHKAGRLLLALGVVALVASAVLLATAMLDRPGPTRVAEEVPVTAMDHVVGPSNNSPVLLAEPGEPRFVVMANRLDAPTFGCALQVSGDGGRGWAPANPVPQLPQGAEECYSPEVAFDRQGTLYYLFWAWPAGVISQWGFS